MVKIVHVGYSHVYNDVRILKKECMTLKRSGLYDVTYVTSDKNGKPLNNNIDDVHLQVLELSGKRGVRYFKYLRKLKKVLLEIDGELYHIHEFVLLPLIPFLKRRGKIVIYDMHEDSENDWANRLKKYGFKLSKIVKKCISYYEKWMIKKSDGFIYVTPQFKKQGNPRTIEALLPNFPQIISDDDLPSFSYEEYMKRHNSICFAGGIADKWNHSRIIRGLTHIGGVEYNLAGRGSQSFLKELQFLDGWKQVNFYGMIPFEKVKKIYSSSKIGVALLSYVFGEDRTGTLGNTKIYEFMQAGLPIICTDFEIWRDIIDKYNCGIYIDPTDDIELRKAIIYLIENQREAYFMGKNGQNAIKNEYNWKKCEKSLLELYHNLIGEYPAI